MKHWIAFGLLGAAIVFFATRKSDVDKLMVPVASYDASRTGVRFVEVERALLPVTPHYLAMPGVTTVVYFHDKNCRSCIVADGNVEHFTRLRPDVAVRKVSIAVEGDAYHSAIRDYQWKVYMSPSFIVFDKHGKMLAADDGTDTAGTELFEAWMEKEADKANRSAPAPAK